MIALMKRILSVSGPYQGRIKLAFIFAFLKAMLSKAPIGLSFLSLSAFLQGTITARWCLWLAAEGAAAWRGSAEKGGDEA